MLQLLQIKKSFGDKAILKGFDLTIKPGEFIVLLGPSGCGKSTLLRLIAGLDLPTSGDIQLRGESILSRSPTERRMAMVFQNFALYPHMTVFDNIAFPLQMLKTPRSQIKERVAEVAELLQINEHLLKKPGQLSGGQKQRVAIGRAIVRQPEFFLFDEPLANLDTQLRVRMRSEIAMLHLKLKTTSIYVTHDQVEAMTLGDRVIVLNQGWIEQDAPPALVYQTPKTKFVGEFMGSPPMNYFLTYKAKNDAKAFYTGVRPQYVRLSGEVPLGQGHVEHLEHMGSEVHVHVAMNQGGRGAFVTETNTTITPGQKVELYCEAKHVLFYDESGRLLS
jgi:multiple sugar transport system ATP-binding protein